MKVQEGKSAEAVTWLVCWQSSREPERLQRDEQTESSTQEVGREQVLQGRSVDLILSGMKTSGVF